jgi:hypothetical protein
MNCQFLEIFGSHSVCAHILNMASLLSLSRTILNQYYKIQNLRIGHVVWLKWGSTSFIFALDRLIKTARGNGNEANKLE